MASRFQQSLQMLQELKQSHQQLHDSNIYKEKEIKLVKERQQSETRELEKNLQSKYQGDLKDFQASYMQQFDQKALE